MSSIKKQVAGFVKLGKSSYNLATSVYTTSKAVVRKEGPKARGCNRCSAPAKTWCVDCKEALCKFCATLLHHPTTKFEKHSIEEIKEKDEGVQIITPILLDLMIFAGVALMVYEAQSMEWRVENFCPCIGRARRITAYIDMNVFYWYKREFATACNVEDSFWRLIIDTWVRGFVTGHDSILLIFSTLGAAVIFEEGVRFLLAPVLGFTYACLATAARWAERHISTKYAAQLDVIEKFEKKMAKFAFSRFFAADGKPPPLTFPRRRPKTDTYEQVMYHWERQVRSFQYYKGHAQAIVNYMLRFVVFVCASLRVICMVVPLNSLVRVILGAVGFGGLLDRHAHYFQSATGIYHQESVFTDWAFMITIRSLISQLPGIGSMGTGLLGDTFNLSIAALRSKFVIICLFGFGAYFLTRRKVKAYLAAERKAFDKTWAAEGGTCFDIWGVTPPDKKEMDKWRKDGGGCGRVAWSERVFRKETQGPPNGNGESHS